MILFCEDVDTPRGAIHYVVIFGVGLIGKSIATSLKSCRPVSFMHLPLSWDRANQREIDLLAVTEQILEPRRNTLNIHQVDVIWSAGAAGFASSEQQLENEACSFRDVVAWTRSLRRSLPKAQLAFHLVSSAGGLFEGQRFIDAASIPNPQRPYGRLKVKQEEIADKLLSDLPILIYRPSSVYGFTKAQMRLGIINTLLLNSQRHQVTRIFGTLHTLRDYVFAQDIGQFIVKRTHTCKIKSEVFTLASGKPTSVNELLGIMEQVFNRMPYAKLDLHPSNADHITYRKSILPRDWTPTDLKTGIRLVAMHHGIS
jgi:nucleoside-diphosphate-sugar epimerase